MRVLVVGSGGREHALIHSLSRSPMVSDLIAYPGRAGFEPEARLVSGEGTNPDLILKVAERESADLTIVGPEAPLVAGVADRFAEAGRLLFGPSKAAARLEGSKVFAKQVLVESGVPTGRSAVARSMKEVPEAISVVGMPAAVKADGLAAGKGVVIVHSPEEATEVARRFLEERLLGEAGNTLLFEEFLRGEELSVLAFVRDEEFLLFPPSRDYKRIGEGGTGPNTGGMGAITPVPGVGESVFEKVREEVFRPVLRTMVNMGCPYSGILYAGLMLTDQGPKVLEFNCRFGDPETQAVLALVRSDLAPWFLAIAKGEWAQGSLESTTGAAACIVLASAGYPSKAQTGDPIEGLHRSPREGVFRLHAGTAREGGKTVTAGGRVMNVVATAENLNLALESAYEEADSIRFRGVQIRRDIGKPGVQG